MLKPSDPRIKKLAKELKGSDREPFLKASSRIPKEMGQGWRDLLADQAPGCGVSFIMACDMGLADACFALIGFQDETYLVGRGESLRPFITYYCGKNEKSAWRAFEQHVLEEAFPG